MSIATILSAPWEWSKRQLTRQAIDTEQVKKTVVNADPSQGYRPSRFFSTDVLIKDLPMYTVFAGKMMLDCDPLIQYALNVRNAALSVAEVEITAKRPDVKAWLESQWHTLWEVNGNKIRKTKNWGYAGLQPTFRTNPRTGLMQSLTRKARSQARQARRRQAEAWSSANRPIRSQISNRT